MSALASVYVETGEYAKAEPLYRQAVEIDKALLGKKWERAEKRLRFRAGSRRRSECVRSNSGGLTPLGAADVAEAGRLPMVEAACRWRRGMRYRDVRQREG